MNVSEAISRARQLKPNLYEDDLLEGFLRELDGKVGEELGIRNAECGMGDALLVPFPFDGVYPLYLVAMIDFHNRETDSYQNDMAVFNAALGEFRAWWRRGSLPAQKGGWKL